MVHNHRVISALGMLPWLLQMIGEDHWNRAVTELTSKGFRLDAVVGYCALELEDKKYILTQICHWYYGLFEHKHGTSQFGIKSHMSYNIRPFN